ncbi:MAG: redoxin domain-containing protein [Candidatus Campbellbacteria bacterium]|nr:redoxin domain-containing protein [Candidatus Campbellbacteria bacterium]
MEDNINNKIIGVSKEVPDCSFDLYQNGKIERKKFSDFRGKWLILFFYPADFTFICPTELEEMAQYYEEFKKEGAEVISFSTDTAFAHKAWHDTSPAVSKVGFPMGSDATGKIAKSFGIYIDDEGVTLRGTYLLNKDGIVKSVEINDNSIGRSAKELLRKLRAAIEVEKTGGKKVCPASWEPGKDKLEPGENLVGKI